MEIDTKIPVKIKIELLFSCKKFRVHKANPNEFIANIRGNKSIAPKRNVEESINKPNVANVMEIIIKNTYLGYKDVG